jgi:hypothetical protein
MQMPFRFQEQFMRTRMRIDKTLPFRLEQSLNFFRFNPHGVVLA